MIAKQEIKVIEQFFAITSKEKGSSLYQVDLVRKRNECFPIAEKVAVRGEAGVVNLGEKLSAGYPLLGVAANLIWYAPYPRFGPGFEDGVIALGARTSPVSAYFLDRSTAFRAFEMEVLIFRDALWTEASRETLEEIGDEHPYFYVSHRPNWGFFESNDILIPSPHAPIQVLDDGEPAFGSIFNGGPQF